MAAVNADEHTGVCAFRQVTFLHKRNGNLWCEGRTLCKLEDIILEWVCASVWLKFLFYMPTHIFYSLLIL